MKKSTIVFSALNMLGMAWMILFVAGARHQALMEGRAAYDFGDSFGFLLIVIPVLSLCFIADGVCFVMAVVEVYRRRSCRSAIACLTAIAANPE